MTDTLATVNGTPITRTELDNAIQGLSMELHRKTMDQLESDEVDALREMAIEKLIARELIFQAALSRGIVAEEEQIEKERQKIVGNFPSEEEFYTTLKKAGIDAADYHRMLRQDLTVNKMTAEQIESVPEPTENEVAAAAESHPELMTRSGRVRACHILLRIPEGERQQTVERLQELRARAKEEDFSQLARLHSACPSAPGGGDLGYFRRGEMAKPFEEAAFSQPVGEVGDVVETQFGLHLIKVIDREQDSTLSLAEATPRIKRFLKDQRSSRHLKGWVDRLRRDAEIVIEP